MGVLQLSPGPTPTPLTLPLIAFEKEIERERERVGSSRVIQQLFYRSIYVSYDLKDLPAWTGYDNDKSYRRHKLKCKLKVTKEKEKKKKI